MDSLKNIKHELEETENLDAIQVIIDENVFNMFLRQFAFKSFSQSLRDQLKRGPENAKMALNFMNTSIASKLIPALTEEFGENRNLDLLIAGNADFMKDKLENYSETGITIKKSGNIALKVNLAIQILVEDELKKWQSARDLFIQLQFKVKMYFDVDEDGILVFHLVPVGLEVSQLNIFAGDEDKPMEQMLALSMLNLQLDMIGKKIEPQSFPLGASTSSVEQSLTSCFGFML